MIPAYFTNFFFNPMNDAFGKVNSSPHLHSDYELLFENKQIKLNIRYTKSILNEWSCDFTLSSYKNSKYGYLFDFAIYLSKHSPFVGDYCISVNLQHINHFNLDSISQKTEDLINKTIEIFYHYLTYDVNFPPLKNKV